MSTEVKFEDGKLIVSRTYAAPRDAVFDAWFETSKLRQWWGCAECTGVRSEVERKVGGAYNHHMTIEGVPEEVPGYATLTEYDPPARLAYSSPSPAGTGEMMVVSVDFTEVEGGTHVRLVHAGIPDMQVPGDVELREIIRTGWSAAFQKLDGFLTTTATS